MKYFLDTEFNEDGRTIDLISLRSCARTAASSTPSTETPSSTG